MMNGAVVWYWYRYRIAWNRDVFYASSLRMLRISENFHVHQKFRLLSHPLHIVKFSLVKTQKNALFRLNEMMNSKEVAVMVSWCLRPPHLTHPRS